MRRRVLVLVTATTTLVLIAFLVPLALLVRTVATDRAVATATAQAQSLSPLVATADREALALAVGQVDATTPADVTLFLPDGTVLGTPAARTPLVQLGSRGVSASGAVPGGREIVVAVRDATRAGGAVRAFVPDAELTRGVDRSWLLLAGLGITLLAVGLVLADRLARRLVRATTDLAVVSDRLARGDLDARADAAAPAELGVVAGALNGLAGRIADLLREERETVADLAHRVRTPLTSLRLEVESLPAADAARVGAGVDAVQRAVTAAIEQARRRGADPAACDASAVVAERVAFWAVLAEDTDRELTVELAPGPLPVALPRSDLEAVVDALLGNVFAHTPDGTSLAVRLDAEPAGATLTVTDTGPGIPADAPALDRGVSGAGSTGLGLDIARRAAERSGGGLRLESPGRGLRVVVSLGAPDRT
ncbi:sensor histidine kinase [Pseudonocardia dioxanivorans]|uniref:sensor histidine kinase n=1 Tax=Pseudonocardia dioxanivorans TaxID=240495 RepID=UPI000CD20B84|nr:HAMP domain-containing sensor histidine kinase [Pseudonocardia dioxanivorans]